MVTFPLTKPNKRATIPVQGWCRPFWGLLPWAVRGIGRKDRPKGRSFFARAAIFRILQSENCQITTRKYVLLENRTLYITSGRLPTLLPRPTQQKLIILLRSEARKKYQRRLPSELNKILLVVALGFLALPLSLRLSRTILSHSRPTCQVNFRPGRLLRRLYLAEYCISAIA